MPRAADDHFSGLTDAENCISTCCTRTRSSASINPDNNNDDDDDDV
jgi:hypothetical protein